METGQPTGRIIASLAAPTEPRPTINYILCGPADDQYQSKHQQTKLVKAAMVKAKVNVVHTESGQGEVEHIVWVDFQVLENPSSRRNSFSLESPLTFCFNFIKRKTK